MVHINISRKASRKIRAAAEEEQRQTDNPVLLEQQEDASAVLLPHWSVRQAAVATVPGSETGGAKSEFIAGQDELDDVTAVLRYVMPRLEVGSRSYLSNLLHFLASQLEQSPQRCSRCSAGVIAQGTEFLSQDQQNTTVYIIHAGTEEARAGVYLDGKKVTDLQPPTVVGEMAIKNLGRATASVVAEGGDLYAVTIPYDLVETALRAKVLTAKEIERFVLKQQRQLKRQRKADKDAALRSEEAFFFQENPEPVPDAEAIADLDERHTPLPIVRRFTPDIGFSLRSGVLAGLFSQLVFPHIAEQVQKTGEFIYNPDERRRRTRMFVAAVTLHGPDSAIGQLMIRKINRIHARHGITAGKYSDEFEHVIYTLVEYPLVFNRRYSHRHLTAKEERAWYSLWKRAGELMGCKNLPEDYLQFVRRCRQREKAKMHEQKHAHPKNASHHIAPQVIQTASQNAPLVFRPLVRHTLLSIPQEITEALHLRSSPRVRRVVEWLLGVRRSVLPGILNMVSDPLRSFLRAFPFRIVHDLKEARFTNRQRLGEAVEMLNRARREMRYLADNYVALQQKNPVEATGADGVGERLKSVDDCGEFTKRYVLDILDRLPDGFRIQRPLQEIGEDVGYRSVGEFTAQIERSDTPGKRPETWIKFFDMLSRAVGQNISSFSIT